MPRIIKKDVPPAYPQLTGFASNVTGATFTLTTNATSDGLAHQVSIRNDAATDHSGKTITLVGTDANGDALTEAVTGPTGTATVESTGYFKTLTSATPSATIGADTFDIGWVDEVSTPTYPINHHSEIAATAAVSMSGTASFTVHETFENVRGGDSPVWFAVSALTTKTANTRAQISPHATAVRLILNSYTGGAAAHLSILESDC